MRSRNALQVLLTFDSPAADVDITSYVLHGYIDRRRHRPGPQQAGTCNITLKNMTRVFDPPWPGATPGVLGSIRPGQHVQVFYNSEQVFDGHIDDWDHDWPVSGAPTATLKASDALARLAQRKFTEWQTAIGQRIGDRLAAALARPEVDWAGATDFDNGAMNLQADLVRAGTDVVSYFQQLERTDGGRFFAARDNTLTYRALNLPAVPAVAATFTDDQTGDSGIYGLIVGYGSEEWYTQVNATRVDGTTQTASSVSGVTDLHSGGFRPLDLNQLLMTTDSSALNLAQYDLTIYEDLTPAITELRCVLDDLADADGTQVAALEIADRVAVEWTPTGAGDPADQTLAVDGTTDDFTPDLWVRTIALSRFIGIQGFVLDDAALGELDTSTLGV